MTGRVITNVKEIIESDLLLFDLTSKPVNYYESLMSIQYFYKEMPLYLKKVQEKINRIN